MHIGILQTGYTPEGVAARHGDFIAMFQRILDGHNFTYSSWNVVDMDFPDSPDQADGWLITGSKHGAYEDHPFIPPLEDLIRAIHTAGRPMIGICFGHQIIAQAMGGRVEKFAGGWAIGRQEYQMGDETVALNAWHQDQVVERPAMARTIATNDFCENAGLLYGDKIFTLQPHPEITNAVAQTYIDVLTGTGRAPDDMMQAAKPGTQIPNDETAMAQTMARFFKGEMPA